MKKIIPACIAVLCLFAAPLCADEFPSLDEAQTLISKAIDTFSAGKMQEGMDMVKPYWNESPDKIDNLVVQAKSQWDMISSNYGQKIGMELISAQPAGTSLTKMTWLAKYEKYGLRFTVMLYRNNQGWSIVNFTYDDQLSNLF